MNKTHKVIAMDKTKKDIFVKGTDTVKKAPRFGVIHTRVEKSKKQYSRKKKHKALDTH